MVLVGKWIAAIEFKAGGDVFHELIRHKPQDLSTITPEKVQGCDLYEGQFGHIGTIDVVVDDDEISRFILLFSQQIPILEEEIHSFLQLHQQQHRYHLSSSSSDYTSVVKKQPQQQHLLGFDEQIKTLKEWIFAGAVNFNSRTIVGMTGIGKTSLAKHIYNDPDVIKAFETRVFVHIGPRYTQFHEIMLVIFYQLGVVLPTSNLHLLEDASYLRHHLSNAISGEDILLVLDDVWTDAHDWLQLQFQTFPFAVNYRYRLIITSRIQSLPNKNYSGGEIILPLLKDDDGWKLLHQ